MAGQDLRMIRKDSILRLDSGVGIKAHNHLKERIFYNEEVTKARGVMSQHRANKEADQAGKKISFLKDIKENIVSKERQFDKKMTQKLDALKRPINPKAPFLHTMNRQRQHEERVRQAVERRRMLS